MGKKHAQAILTYQDPYQKPVEYPPDAVKERPPIQVWNGDATPAFFFLSLSLSAMARLRCTREKKLLSFYPSFLRVAFQADDIKLHVQVTAYLKGLF